MSVKRQRGDRRRRVRRSRQPRRRHGHAEDRDREQGHNDARGPQRRAGAHGRHRYDQEKAREGQPIQTTVVTLLVTPQDAEKIALAASEGSIMLTLRNPMDRDADSDHRRPHRSPARPARAGAGREAFAAGRRVVVAGATATAPPPLPPKALLPSRRSGRRNAEKRSSVMAAHRSTRYLRARRLLLAATSSLGRCAGAAVAAAGGHAGAAAGAAEGTIPQGAAHGGPFDGDHH